MWCFSFIACLMMPSVYQLHMHVHVYDTRGPDNTRPHIRRHLLQQIVRNLILDGEHYANALIMTPLPKALKYSGIFECIFDNFDAPTFHTCSTNRGYETHDCHTKTDSVLNKSVLNGGQIDIDIRCKCDGNYFANKLSKHSRNARNCLEFPIS